MVVRTISHRSNPFSLLLLTSRTASLDVPLTGQPTAQPLLGDVWGSWPDCNMLMCWFLWHFSSQPLPTPNGFCKISSRHFQMQEVFFCIFWKQNIFLQSVRCARNKLQFLTAPQSLKLFFWMLDDVWMGYLLLINGTLGSRSYVQPRTTFNLVTQAPENLSRTNPTIPAQWNLSVFIPSRLFVIPKSRPNLIEKMGLIN